MFKISQGESVMPVWVLEFTVGQLKYVESSLNPDGLTNALMFTFTLCVYEILKHSLHNYAIRGFMNAATVY